MVVISSSRHNGVPSGWLLRWKGLNLQAIAQEERLAYVLEELLGYVFNDTKLARLALTDRSAENDINRNNRRLEFLGDAVLDVATSLFLLKQPFVLLTMPLVQRVQFLQTKDIIAKKMREYRIDALVTRGTKQKENSALPEQVWVSILEDAWEAILGAVHVDSNYYLQASLPIVEQVYRKELHKLKCMLGKMRRRALTPKKISRYVRSEIERAIDYTFKRPDCLGFVLRTLSPRVGSIALTFVGHALLKLARIEKCFRSLPDSDVRELSNRYMYYCRNDSIAFAKNLGETIGCIKQQHDIEIRANRASSRDMRRIAARIVGCVAYDGGAAYGLVAARRVVSALEDNN